MKSKVIQSNVNLLVTNLVYTQYSNMFRPFKQVVIRLT